MKLNVRTVAFAILLSLTALPSGAQSPPVAAAPAQPVPSISPDLDRLQAAAALANNDIAQMHIDKWKADSGSKQQAQTNADSLRRNLSTALPGLIDSFRASPQDLTAGFKLYRNLNALFDVLASFTESVGAFGPKNEYEALAQQVMVIDSVRRALGENLEHLTASMQSELIRLRAEVQSQHQAAAAAPPKKVVVDDNEPPKKTVHKKKPSSSTASESGASQSTSQTSPKSQ